MLRVAIIGYTLLHGFFYTCEYCMANSAYWTPYYIIDEIVGGGVILWWHAYTHSAKYRIPAFTLFIFSCIRVLWNISCYVVGVNRSDTRWTMILFFFLLPVVYWTLFAPDGMLTQFLDRNLKRFKL